MIDGIQSNQGGTGDAEFDENNDGVVIETGTVEGEPKREPAAKSPKPAANPKEIEKPAVDDGDDGEEGDEGEDGEDDEEGDEGEEQPKKRKTPSERIRELNSRLRREERLRLASDERLAALERGLQPNRGGATSAPEIGDAPDPSDAAKYPLGHLDDRYIEDKLEWLATKKAAERADAVLQRQQADEQVKAAERQRDELLEKVDDLATRGSEIFDDFQESVVEAGMRGDWRLEQATFEAAHEAEHGAQILYDLSRDKKEAARVASLSPFQQMKFVMDRDREISAQGKPRTKPGAGEPPKTLTRGANSRTAPNPATDDLDEFEKAWEADAKRSR